MASYEFNRLQQQLIILQKQVQCLAKQVNNTPTPPSDCVGITIITQPQPLSLITGQSGTLSVSVTGDTPIVYQWKKNGVSISGATSSTYSIADGEVSDSGNYSVTISNPCGIVNSNVVGVVVTQSQLRFTAYWGWMGDQIVSTNDILSLQGIGQFDTGTDILADFRDNGDPKWLIMAEPLTEPLKTKWYGSDQNSGSIGTDEDLFGAPVAIGAFRVYTSNYQTQQQQTPIQFKVS